MATINLLPWREGLRKQQQDDFVAAIGIGVLVTCFLFAGVYFYVDGMKNYQEMRNRLLSSEISFVDKKITEIKDIEDKKSLLLTKIDVINELQESRPQIVYLFDELAKVTPEGVVLTKFKQTGKALDFSGKAQSSARVSVYMRNIEDSEWLELPVLQEIKGASGDKSAQFNEFSMRAKQG